MIRTEYYPHGSESNKVVGDFVSQVTFGVPGVLKDFCSMAVIRDSELIAGVLYTEYYAGSGSIEISAASVDRRWMTRKVIHDMFSLPFVVLGSHLVVVKTAETNMPVRNISERTGLTKHFIPDLRGEGKGEYIYTMNKALWDSLPYRGAKHESA